MAHDQYESCIAACYSCAAACDACATACLSEDDVKMMARCIRLDIDCAQLCRLAASYMARDSDFADAICIACAEVCDACAEECAQHPMDHCARCAEACRQCAQECRRMTSAMPATAAGQGAGIAAH